MSNSDESQFHFKMRGKCTSSNGRITTFLEVLVTMESGSPPQRGFRTLNRVHWVYDIQELSGVLTVWPS